MFNKSLFGQNSQSVNPQSNWVRKNIDGFNMHLNPYDGGISAALYVQGGREFPSTYIHFKIVVDSPE